MVEIRDAAASGDRERAREIRRHDVEPVLRAVADHGYVPILKRLLATRETIETPAVRPPLTTAPADAVEGLD